MPSHADLCRHAGAPIQAAVFCAESYNALAVVRGLGRRGVPVLALGSGESPIAFHSRYTSMHAIVPDPVRDQEGFIRAAIAAGRRAREGGARVVAFPTSDRVIKIISDHREAFSAEFDLYLPEQKVLNRCLDKLAQYRVCDELGIPYPLTYSDGEELRLAGDLASGRVSTPLFFKARTSLPDEQMTRRFRRVPLRTRAEVEGHLQEAAAAKIPYVIQEVVPGGDDQLYTLGVAMDRDGRVLAAFTGRKLRQMPPGFGICRVGESVSEPVVRDQGIRLLRALGFCGIAQVEFKRDARDGTYRLMEVNPRTWSWIGLPIAIGCDLPYAQLCAAVGFRLAENDALPTLHALWISLTHDLEWSLARRDGRPWEDLLGVHDRIVESHFALDDPYPGWVNAGSLLADYAKRAGRKLGALIPARTRASRENA